MQPQATQLAQASPTSSTLNSWSVPHDLRDGSGRKLSAIDRLYARFDAMYMQKWRSHFTSPEVIEDWKKAWSSALVRNGITLQMALAGLERCSAEYPKWPPSEGEFVALCKPPLDYEEAFHDAVRQMHKRQMADPKDPDVWPHPAIYWAAMDFGQYELRHVSYSQAAGRWKRLLDKRLEGECPSVEPSRPQLAAPARNAEGAAITSAEAKAAAMRAMAQLANRAPSQALAIRRARDILARKEAGEPITQAQVAFAKEALARLRADSSEPDPSTEQE